MSAEKEIVDEVARNPSVARWVIEILWGALITLAGVFGGVLLRRHGQEMTELKQSIAAAKAKLAEVEGEMHRSFVREEEYEQNRREMREGVIALHAKIETGLSGVHQKIDTNHREIMGALLKHVSDKGK